ncbi:protein aurora borealis [Chanos chanos]|uniref:Protein aurora borealis n=1 Tax=Chanos chanos TaxID=29144 RepID=A0A6J2VPE9_CHACN|nr:protein aurora borealis [Chanos chanos]
MGDAAEPYVTPETPARPAILNPFESPNDYHRLREPIVSSPSVFKWSTASSATPAKFKWSIDEMASLLPVHIDPEDIHRQSLYMSQTRTDSEIEAKRQSAIDQFFTKGTIVPSPWGAPTSKPLLQGHHEKSPLSPLVTDEPQSTKKINATCQTILSLPVDFDLEKILGDHYKTEEVSEQVQDSLSSSSLRRKLFLDGIGSGSESSTPSSPEREHDAPLGGGDMMSSVIVSPVQCKMAARTPSSGQFSSSPIQDRCRAYSLGSVTSPMFPERTSPLFKSPTLSPIVLQHARTPMSGERKKLSFVTPEAAPLGSSDIALSHCGESPYVEGCSPIRSCSPFQPRHKSAQGWASPPHISPILNPALLDKDNINLSQPLPTMDLDSCSPSLARRQPERVWSGESVAMLPELHQMEQEEASEEKKMEEEGKGVEKKTKSREKEKEHRRSSSKEESCAWGPEEEDGASPVRLTSSRTGSVSNAESTHMFVSLLTEGSCNPYDMSMQVDSGYNTYSVCTNSLMDGISSDSQSKELFDTHVPEEGTAYIKHTRSKSLLFVNTSPDYTSNSRA